LVRRGYYLDNGEFVDKTTPYIPTIKEGIRHGYYSDTDFIEQDDEDRDD